ncbi:MAG TPA: FdrA family protein [Streptosporangiaceae bacterium]|nr:FdrA family protein [Streptosporangiaceae bacterium]
MNEPEAAAGPAWVDVRRGLYRDSITLMRISRGLAERDGVLGALTAMATDLNLELLSRLGFTAPPDVGPNDLVVAIRATDEATLGGARDVLDAMLTEAPAAYAPGAPGAPGTPGDDQVPARTIATAAARAARSSGIAGTAPTLALVSVPGRHAFVEAMDALESGLNVMIFSDNVPVAEEILLKDAAARRGLIVMGPDCGTAVVGGAGLGFANAVRPGPVGIVAASGTGSQQVMCLLDAAGVGVSHAIGVGGRDLSAEVSGRGTLQALAALSADPATELIVMVSKPPAPPVAALIREAARRLTTPVVFAVLGDGDGIGSGAGIRGPGGRHERRAGRDLTAAVEAALAVLGVPVPSWPSWPAAVPPRPRPGALRGLFAGGTLCAEALHIAAGTLGTVHSNLPGRPAGDTGHVMIDFGDDRLTQGRAHPMIDPSLRLERLAAELADPSCSVVLLDVVLGYAAEPDPAARLAPLIGQAGDTAVVVSLCGTPHDPQGRDRQAAALRDAGATVFASNAAAARYAVSLIEVSEHSVIEGHRR